MKLKENVFNVDPIIAIIDGLQRLYLPPLEGYAYGMYVNDRSGHISFGRSNISGCICEGKWAERFEAIPLFGFAFKLLPESLISIKVHSNSLQQGPELFDSEREFISQIKVIAVLDTENYLADYLSIEGYEECDFAKVNSFLGLIETFLCGIKSSDERQLLMIHM